MATEIIAPDTCVAVLGLGYVGLPLAEAFAAVHPRVIGFDIDPARVSALASRAGPGLTLTSDPHVLRGATAFVLAVPTPIDAARYPDLGALEAAADIVAGAIAPGALVIVESTVAPGTTEELVGPRIAMAAGLNLGVDLFVAYSPERINPGDAEHALAKVPKVIAAPDAHTLARLRSLYGPAITAGLIEAPSIRAAELAKLVENTQRDLNIALMNEVAIISERLGLRTADVLAVARTKWNFLPFEPGLVGGHCISVDPWYLARHAESLGLHPAVVSAGRRTNDSMASFVAHKTLKLLSAGPAPKAAPRIGVFGITFKEDFPDIRNSGVVGLCAELTHFGAEVLVHDPVADPADVKARTGIALSARAALQDLDALILAVRHRQFLAEGSGILDVLTPGGLLVDVKSAIAPSAVPAPYRYWSL